MINSLVNIIIFNSIQIPTFKNSKKYNNNKNGQYYTIVYIIITDHRKSIGTRIHHVYNRSK